MRRLILLALLVAAAPASGVQTVSRSLSATGERPAELVARMAREAMGLPADPAGWSALANALPEMALLGGADLESTFEAARIADSLSASASALAEPAVGADPGVMESVKTILLSSLMQGRWMDIVLAFLVTGAVGAGIVLLRRRRKNPKKAKAPYRGDRVRAARSLASSGLSVHEIARRTGMAQDAVHVLMSLAGSAPAPAAPTRTRPPTSVVGSHVNASDLQREAHQAARRLRDQRLTYGPGARA